ncbi:hypothetical protein B296_00009766 [Ensete ventricosum]|uniref:Uncharacterized protein n=1 Tax=Ensete ventricosum TaxID=4639 RepID=A0A426XH96_ENSVE|nr:hypothetical protein B296_00009766 [Ensete ventricosum]
MSSRLRFFKWLISIERWQPRDLSRKAVAMVEEEEGNSDVGYGYGWCGRSKGAAAIGGRWGSDVHDWMRVAVEGIRGLGGHLVVDGVEGLCAAGRAMALVLRASWFSLSSFVVRRRWLP